MLGMDTYWATIVYRHTPAETASAVFEWQGLARDEAEAAIRAGIELGTRLTRMSYPADASAIQIRASSIERRG